MIAAYLDGAHVSTNADSRDLVRQLDEADRICVRELVGARRDGSEAIRLE